MRTKVKLAILFCLILAISLVLGLEIAQWAIHSTGKVKGVGVAVYADAGCTQNLTLIDWGIVNPGSAYPRTFYVKNTGNTNITVTMTLSNWVPTNANTYLSCTWDSENATLTAGAVKTCVVNLSVGSSAPKGTNFDFDITITGTG